jgi:hypothetical protein
MKVSFKQRFSRQDLVKKFVICPFCDKDLKFYEYLDIGVKWFSCKPCLFSIRAKEDGYWQYKFEVHFTINHDLFVEIGEGGIFLRHTDIKKDKLLSDTVDCIDVKWAREEFVDKYLVLK